MHEDHKIIFRTNAGPEIGLGHLNRCMAMAKMLDGFTCIFIGKISDPAATATVRKIYEVVELPVSCTKEEELVVLQARVAAKDVLVLDGYDFDDAYRTSVRSLCRRLVVVDDLAKGFIGADVVINHGSAAIATNYDVGAGTALYLGFKYALLQPDFLTMASQPAIYRDRPATAFICLGGADPFNLTIKAIEAVLRVDGVKNINVVVGSSYVHGKALNAMLAGNLGRAATINLESNVAPARMATLISESDVCLAPSSSIALEICAVGAALVTGTFVNNQRWLHDELILNQCAISIGNWGDAEVTEIANFVERALRPDTNREMIKNQKRAIDGRSGARVAAIFNQLIC